MATGSILAIVFVLLGLSFHSGRSTPVERDYKTEWMREHWGIDSIVPLSDENREGRQFAGFGDLGKVVDTVGKFDLREVSKFLKEIPELFESVQSIVDGAENSFGVDESD